MYIWAVINAIDIIYKYMYSYAYHIISTCVFVMSSQEGEHVGIDDGDVVVVLTWLVGIMINDCILSVTGLREKGREEYALLHRDTKRR